MTDPFQEGYLDAAANRRVIVSPYLWGTVQFSVWWHGFDAYAQDRLHQRCRRDPQLEPEFARRPAADG